MSLLQQLDDDLKVAMRGRDRLRSDAIRQIKTAATYAGLQQSGPLDDTQVQEVVGRLIRQHRESVEMFKLGKRQELVDKEEAELRILLAYLPQQMSEGEIMALARQIAQEVGAKGPTDKGKVMGRLMPQVKGKAEGRLVNDVVMKVLEDNGG